MPAISPPPPTGTKIGRHVAEAVPQDFVADGALAGNHERVIERVHERAAGGLDDAVAVGLRVGVAVARQHHFSPHLANRVHFDRGGRLRHHDDGAQTEMPCGEGHTLAVIAGARGNHPPAPFRLRHVGDPVVGAAQLEAEDRLKILTLQENGVPEARRQPARGLERCLLSHVVDAARENKSQQGVRGH